MNLKPKDFVAFKYKTKTLTGRIKRIDKNKFGITIEVNRENQIFNITPKDVVEAKRYVFGNLEKVEI